MRNDPPHPNPAPRDAARADHHRAGGAGYACRLVAAMSRATVTPLDALKRLIAVAKTADALGFEKLGGWNAFQGELTVAEMVVRDWVEPDAAQPAVVVAPKGWRLVPIEATESMYKADIVRGNGDEYVNQSIWRCMLEAAPAISAPLEVAILPEKMSPDMREAMWEAITRHGLANLEYWIEDLYNDIRIAAIATGDKHE